jgi:uncharacterized protein
MNADHRPWPLPPGPWVHFQRWHDLLFAHWRAEADLVRRLLPPGIPLDTFEDTAWIGVVPFRMSRVRLRGTPPLPGLSAFPELNVRTYVRRDDRPGVYFFSLDAANRVAVAAARRLYLPYFHARMGCLPAGEEVGYDSRRVHRGAPPAAFRGRYRPTGPPERAAPGSLAHWLTERYCLYVRTPGGSVWRGEIHHEPWPLQPAEAEVVVNTMAAPMGVPLEGPPLLHFARRLDVRFWPPERADRP